MKNTTNFVVRYRRKREGKTNYKKRLALLKSEQKRIVIRQTSTRIIIQAVEYSPTGDKIIAAVDSSRLKEYGWKGSFKNISAAYLTGLVLGKLALKSKITNAILDSGMNKTTKGSRIFAALKGVIDSGVIVPVNEDILPSEERINGKHIKAHAESLKGKEEEYKKRFSQYIKNGLNPEDIDKNCAETKNTILKN